MGLGRRHDAALFERVGTRGFAGPWEQLANALEQSQQRGVGSKAHDQALLSHGGQVGHHQLGLGLRVVDEHIEADHRVEATFQTLQITGLKLQPAIVQASALGPAFGLSHHRF